MIEDDEEGPEERMRAAEGCVGDMCGILGIFLIVGLLYFARYYLWPW